jgi:hypothetical protein
MCLFPARKHAVIRAYDEAANVIDTHEHKGERVVQYGLWLDKYAIPFSH